MAKTVKIEPGIYLMGRLYDQKGRVCKNAKLTPLRFETLALPEKEIVEIINFNGEGEVVHKIDAKYPIASTNEVGKLSFLRSEAINNDHMSLVSIPTTSKKANNEYKIKFNFFPSQLIPIYQLSNGVNWLKDLSEKLVNLDDSHIFNASVRSLDLSKSKNQLAKKYKLNNSADKESIESKYNQWYDSLSEGTLRIIEVPQFNSIVLSFSDKDLLGAKVTLKEKPGKIMISGDISGQSNEPVSKIKLIDNEIKFTQDDGDSYYVATFWIENEFDVNDLESFYARFDVTFDDLNPAEKMKLSNKGLSISTGYSIKEKVFDLPVRSSSGKSALINGDPISVEESLINHSPEYFKDLIDRFKNDKVKTGDEKKPKSALESAWHQFNVYKGVFQSVVGSLQSEAAWNSKSKIILSTTSVIKEIHSDSDDEFVKNFISASGVGDSINTFIDAASKDYFKDSDISEFQKLHQLFSNEPALLKTIREKLGSKADELNFIEVPPAMKKFLDKSYSYMSDLSNAMKLPLDVGSNVMTAGQAVYNIYDLAKKDEDTEYKDQDFNITSGYYIKRVQSATVNQGNMIVELNDKQIESRMNLILDINEKMKQIGNEENFIDLTESIGKLTVKLISTRFEFDRASLITIDPKVEQGIKELAELIEKLPDPIQIEISGFTCDRGSESYNSQLSRKRAVAVRNAILDAMSDENRLYWTLYISAKGYGESHNRFPNDSEENRRKNRRVEINLNLNSLFDYPVSRVGLNLVEKSRKEVIKAELDYNDAVFNTANSVLELAILGAGFVFPPTAIAGLIVASGNMLSTVVDYGYEKLFKDEDTFKKAIKNLGEIDSTLYSKMLNNSSFGKINVPFVKSYLKRSMALNGLIRLLKRYQLEVHLNPGEASDIKENFNIRGYIDRFVLSDLWDIDGRYSFNLNLDEYWLDRQGTSSEWVLPNVDETIGIALYNLNVIRSNTEDKLKDIESSKNYHKYFPIHYVNSESIDELIETLTVKLPSNLEEDIYKKIVFSARKPGDEKWMKFDEFYEKERDFKISPYDQIRIFIQIDKDNKRIKDQLKNDQIFHLPITVCANAITWADSGDIFDTVASENTEYVRNLHFSELSEHEVEATNCVKGGEVLGVIIEPSFFFGALQIKGTRPIAWYNHPSLTNIFGGGSLFSFSTEFKMDYTYSIEVKGNDDSKKLIKFKDRKKRNSHGIRSDYARGDEREVFTVSLNNDRVYNFKDKVVEGDSLFYDEGFLEDIKPENGNVLKYPKIFDSPKVYFWIKQKGLDIRNRKPNEQRQRNAFYPYLNEEYMAHHTKRFNWNKSAKIRFIVTTNSVDTSIFDRYKYHEKNEIPVGMSLDMNCAERIFQSRHTIGKNEKISLYRIGKIEYENGNYQFIPVQYNKFNDDNYSDIINDFTKLDQNMLKDWVVGDESSGFFSGRDEEQSIDIYGYELEMKYMNALGVSVPGLKPVVGYRTVLENDIQLSLSLSGPINSGLNATSEIIHLREPISFYRSLPSNWIKTKSQKVVDSSIKQVETNSRVDLSSEEKVSIEKSRLNDDKISGHDMTPHIHWIESNPDDLSDINESREMILEKWSGE